MLRGEEKAASLKMTQMESQLAAASEEGSVATSLRTRVASMSRMLEEQQQELADGYLMAATAKLGAALGGHAGSSLAHALETWRRASALMSSTGQLAAPSSDGALQVRVESMSRMLEEQQQELADGYLMAATMKLGAALGGHAGSSLAHAMETWRRASALLSAAAQQPEQGAWAKQEAEYLARIQRLEQDFRRTEKDNRGMALLVSDLETRLAAQKSTDGTAPAPTEGRRARPPISPYVSPSVSRESSRPSSPKPAPSELEASLHSAARKPRSSSPQRTSVADQLHRHHHEYSQHSRA